MGRLHSLNDHKRTLAWAESTADFYIIPCEQPTSLQIQKQCAPTLHAYFALAALSRSKSADQGLRDAAWPHLFRIRTLLERAITQSVLDGDAERSVSHILKTSEFYGFSKKQGVSLRLPLSSCIPTRRCAGGCYAHDAMDASPHAVVRGAFNGAVARFFEHASPRERSRILVLLQKHTRKAVAAALRQTEALAPGWTRRPHIRFAHVGELPEFPGLANALAKQVGALSQHKVDCIVYTRHRNARLLDPALWIINFTLDDSSLQRSEWVPPDARIVFSAWDGKTSPDASTNFLEHHRWTHAEPTGGGAICPTTLPQTPVRTCDAVKCDLCFRRMPETAQKPSHATQETRSSNRS